jgi:hypothetical protein
LTSHAVVSAQVSHFSGSVLSSLHFAQKQIDRENSFSYETIPATKVFPSSSYQPNSGRPDVLYGANNSTEGREDPKSEKMSSAGDAEDIIDYGLSVEVMEDSRREVIQEAMEIRKYNKATEGSINQETEKEKQLKKDLGYAQREIESLCKGIEVEHEKAKTHRSFINKLQADYDLQIVLPLVQRTSHGKPISTTTSHPITPDDRSSTPDKGRGYPSGSKGSTLTKRRVKLFKDLRGKLQMYVRAIEKGCTEIEEARDMLRIVLQIIKDHDLEGTLEKARDDARKFRDDYNEGDRYRQKLYDDIGSAKDKLASLKQETTSKVSNHI